MKKPHKSILVLDDDVSFCTLVRLLLEERGHIVSAAHTGRDGAAWIATHKPDLVIVDGLLPDTDGFAWIKQLRDRNDRTPVLFVSGFWKDLKSYRRLTEELGVNLVIKKPIVVATFIEHIESLLNPTEEAAFSVDINVEVDEPTPSDEMTDLKAEYAAALPKKLEQIARDLGRVTAAPTDQALSNQLRSDLHKLHGTAASYGFEELGEGVGRVARLLAGPKLEGTIIQEATRELERILRKAGIAPKTTVKQTVAPASPERDQRTRVVTVDDDKDVLRLIEIMLKSGNINVTAVNDPLATMDVLKEVSPDLLLLDVNMPGISGFELCRILRASVEWATLPIFLLTASTGTESRIAAFESGADECLAKPITKAELLTRIRTFLDRQRVRRAATLAQPSKPA